MTEGAKTIIYPVTDLAKAKKLYAELLGTEPYADETYYVGFNVEGQEFGLDPNGYGKGMTGTVIYWHVQDIETSLKTLLEAGAETEQEVKDVGGGLLIASVRTQTATSPASYSRLSCTGDESTPGPENPRGG